MKNINEKIAIIGGGISGIAASVYLIEKGYNVDVFESKKNLGGRAGSINSGKNKVDIGQHIFLPSYKNFIELLHKINVQDHLNIEKKLNITVQDNSKKYFIKSNISIYPFNLIFSVLNYKNLKFSERLKILIGLYKLSKIKNYNYKISFETWLKKNWQNQDMIKKFWEIICVPAFNSKLNQVSMNHAVHLFKLMIFKPKKNIGICYFKKPFSEIINKNFEDYLKKYKSNLYLGEKINNINLFNKKYILEGRNKKYSYNKVIIATNISNAINLGKLNNKNLNVTTNGIINIYFWFDKKIINEEFISFSNSKLEWVFSDNKSKKIKKEFKIIVSLSAVGDLIKNSNEKLVNEYENILRKELNISDDTKTIKSLAIRSPKATQIKDQISTINKKNKNLLFVGDWTIQDLPNTMETAVLSSKKLIENNFK